MDIRYFVRPIQNLFGSFKYENSTSQEGTLKGKNLTCDIAWELKRFGQKRVRKHWYFSEVNGQTAIIHTGSLVLVIGKYIDTSVYRLTNISSTPPLMFIVGEKEIVFETESFVFFFLGGGGVHSHN
jgi:hypothetical protein